MALDRMLACWVGPVLDELEERHSGMGLAWSFHDARRLHSRMAEDPSHVGAVDTVHRGMYLVFLPKQAERHEGHHGSSPER